MPARISLLLALAASLLVGISASAKTTHKDKYRTKVSRYVPRDITVKDKDNNGQVTVHPGDTLRVQLNTPHTGKEDWCYLDGGDSSLTRDPFVLFINDSNSRQPTREFPNPEHVPAVIEFRFQVDDDDPAPYMDFLRFVCVPDAGPDLTPVKTWQIHVTIARLPAKGK